MFLSRQTTIIVKRTVAVNGAPELSRFLHRRKTFFDLEHIQDEQW